MSKNGSLEFSSHETTLESKNVSQLVEHLFRHQAGQVGSTLTRFFGVQNLDLVEDVVQETLLKALQQWMFQGIPENPAGWILQSAKNRAIDVLRRQSTFRNKQTEIADKIEQDFNSSIEDPNITLDHEFKDDQLKMIFVCCHPAISREARIALTLKTLCGFSVTEIARAFLSQESTIAQRLVRAKRKIRESDFPFELPDQPEITGRLDSVLEVLYLLFNEGYSAHQGEVLVRDDLCEEAIRLTCILAEHPVGDQPKVHALLAMLFLQASRLPARVDCEGNLLVLKEQDRTLWDEGLVQSGFHHLDRAASGDELSEYHLQAGIASCHATAESYESTDWQRILAYYDELVNMNHSPVVALNRAVALSMVLGPEAGIEALEKLKSLPPMKSYYLLPATYAEFFIQMGKAKQAIKFYRKALELVGTEPEKRFLLRKLKECENSKIDMPANEMK
ncbi:RNA polymerase sigma factor [candidate division KSB1 bacterium]|nr:RNA polymerase sigma factor [candidate division KSB1 bacterium]